MLCADRRHPLQPPAATFKALANSAREKYPEAKPRIISDNGPQSIARDFKEFIRIAGMTHVRTSQHYPPSNGKLERWHKSLKSECIRPGTPLTKEDALRLIHTYVDHYNTVRLYSAIGFVTRTICSRDDRRKSMLNAIGSSSKRVSNGSSDEQQCFECMAARHSLDDSDALPQHRLGRFTDRQSRTQRSDGVRGKGGA